VIGRGTKWSSGLLLTAIMVIGLHQATASMRVHRFLEYYEAVEKTDAPINFWERVVCSFMLTRVEAREAQGPTS